MYFSICSLVILALASIPCDAFDGMDEFGGVFGGNGEDFGMGGFGRMFGMSGFDGMGMGKGGMGGMGTGDDDMKEMAGMSPLIPDKNEKKLCEEKAEEKDTTVANIYKVPKKTCEVVCQFDNNDELVLKSPKGTMCCDMVGVGPTGKCNGKGTCNMMGMDGMKE